MTRLSKSESKMDRPRRGRLNPRVVKVKSSKFELKNDFHKSERRNLQEDLNVFPAAAWNSFTGIGARGKS